MGPAVGSKSVCSALHAVAATLQAHYHSIHDPITFRLAFLLQQQLKGYTNNDPSKKPQKAITSHVLHELITICHTTLDEAISQLAMGAFFFAMRSCEYCKVPDSAKHCTKLLTLKNIQFFHDRRELHHNDPTLHLANSISIMFQYQKNDECNVIITMHWMGDSSLCPVTSWSSIIHCIQHAFLAPPTILQFVLTNVQMAPSAWSPQNRFLIGFRIVFGQLAG
jgi:hypothetical protein